MMSGIYALASLDGAPLERGDCAALNLAFDPLLGPAGGCLIVPRDPQSDAIHRRERDGGIDVMVGDLDEPEDVAADCGLGTGRHDPIDLACALHDRLGADAAALMLGEWLLVRWDRPSRTLTLLMAERMRDRCYVATDGKRVAIAPDYTILAGLPWVDVSFDTEAMLFQLGVSRLRDAVGRSTILRGVRSVLPGSQTTIALKAVHDVTATPFPLPALFDLGFEEAMERVDATLRRIMAQHLARHPAVALMLSGGLDSSLATLAAARERRPGQRLLCLSSAAPPGSRLPDETAWAQATADHLGLPMVKVLPVPAADVYRPSAMNFAAGLQPIPPFQHYLDDAFYAAAVADGADTLITGDGGELTISNYGDAAGPDSRIVRLRQIARKLLRSGRPVPESGGGMGSCFHVRLAPRLLDALPARVLDVCRTAVVPPAAPLPDDRFGIHDGAARMAISPSATPDPRLRLAMPFFDRRLLRQFSAFPAGLVAHGGRWRAPARALLEGRVPRGVVLRQAGRPYSPLHDTLLREQAEGALRRIPDYRSAGAGEWLDLDWLERELGRARSCVPNTLEARHRLQLTAIAAEFFHWWHHRQS